MYYEFGILWAKQGFRVHLIDWTGFGMSGGNKLERTIEDNHKDFTYLLKEFDKDLPLFLYGHSMGSSIIISFLINNPSLKVAGVIASAPPLGIPKPLDIFKKGLAHYVLPELKEFALVSGVNTHAIS